MPSDCVLAFAVVLLIAGGAKRSFESAERNLLADAESEAGSQSCCATTRAGQERRRAGRQAMGKTRKLNCVWL